MRRTPLYPRDAPTRRSRPPPSCENFSSLMSSEIVSEALAADDRVDRERIGGGDAGASSSLSLSRLRFLGGLGAVSAAIISSTAALASKSPSASILFLFAAIRSARDRSYSDALMDAEGGESEAL
eukprot:Amastigsp_a841278_30.p2 type:complete len:125 gc:universal Amastigsp_a841278_30:393-19(-)